MNLDQAFSEFLLKYSGAVVLVIDENSRIVQANRTAEKWLPIDVGETLLKSILIDFSKSLDMSGFISDGSESYLLSLETRCELPFSRNFRFFKTGVLTCAIGEPDYEEFEKLQGILTGTNQELSNKARELHKANAELKRLNIFRNEILGMAAHDLRNPIGTIDLAVKIIEKTANGDLSSVALKYIGIIKSISSNMIHMLTEMLEMAEIESDNLVMRFDSLNLSEIIGQSILLNQESADKKGININFDPDPDIPEMDGDMLKLLQVFNNFISNALKFSHPNTNITITVARELGNLHAVVEDEGQGVPKKEIPDLFKPFTKTSVAPTADESSTGLGLAIVKKIVEAHGGRVHAESTLGIGTRMHVILPIKPE